MYDTLNLLCLSGFATLYFIPCETYALWVRGALVFYFVIDTYKNRHKPDLVLHHLTYASMSILAPFEYVQKCLLLEVSTLFLLLYKRKYPTKIPFVISWVGLRLLYTPWVLHLLCQENLWYVVPTTLVHGLHFHWSCKIVDSTYDTMRGVSSLLLFLPVLTSQDSSWLYTQAMVSFFFHTTRSPLCKTVDTTCIAYFSLNYLGVSSLVPVLVVGLLQARYETKLHQGLFLCAVAKLSWVKPVVACFVALALYGHHQKKIWIWHAGAGLILASR